MHPYSTRMCLLPLGNYNIQVGSSLHRSQSQTDIGRSCINNFNKIWSYNFHSQEKYQPRKQGTSAHFGYNVICF